MWRKRVSKIAILLNQRTLKKNIRYSYSLLYNFISWKIGSVAPFESMKFPIIYSFGVLAFSIGYQWIVRIMVYSMNDHFCQIDSDRWIRENGRQRVIWNWKPKPFHIFVVHSDWSVRLFSWICIWDFDELSRYCLYTHIRASRWGSLRGGFVNCKFLSEKNHRWITLYSPFRIAVWKRSWRNDG